MTALDLTVLRRRHLGVQMITLEYHRCGDDLFLNLLILECFVFSVKLCSHPNRLLLIIRPGASSLLAFD